MAEISDFLVHTLIAIVVCCPASAAALLAWYRLFVWPEHQKQLLAKKELARERKINHDIKNRRQL